VFDGAQRDLLKYHVLLDILVNYKMSLPYHRMKIQELWLLNFHPMIRQTHFIIHKNIKKHMIF
jgi:hypothetical protein